MKTRKFFYFGKFAVLGVGGLIAFTFVVMWLLNSLVPELFNGPLLTYWQILGLLLLSKILFSGIGKGHSNHHSGHHHSGHHHSGHHHMSDRCKDKWKQKFEEKMNGVSDRKKDEGDVIVTG